MTDHYTIYLENQSSGPQLFWCFLQAPVELAGKSGVFANSAASLAVVPNSPDQNCFTIPAQFVVGAGASNDAVEPNVKVTSSITLNANLTDQFSAVYADAPPNMGPALKLSGTAADTKQISIKPNGFNQASNENNGWFSNMSFGVHTAAGFMGMTWSPFPAQTVTLTPTLSFYVAAGTYGANTLAEYTAISNTSAQLTTPDSFKYNAAIVTYTATGGWEVTPGKPPSARSAAALASLADAHRSLTQAHSDLITLVGESAAQSSRLLTAKSQADKVVSVTWDTKAAKHEAAAAQAFLAGTLTVATALTAAFTYFALSGVTFQITSAPVNGRTINFTYSGSQSAAAIQALLKAGAEILLGA